MRRRAAPRPRAVDACVLSERNIPHNRQRQLGGLFMAFCSLMLLIRIVAMLSPDQDL